MNIGIKCIEYTLCSKMLEISSDNSVLEYYVGACDCSMYLVSVVCICYIECVLFGMCALHVRREFLL